MTAGILRCIFGILGPYFLEQYSYQKLMPRKNRDAQESPVLVLQTYGWRVVWDAAHLLVLVGAGYHLIAFNRPFSNWQWIGYISFLSGVLLRIWALRELGEFYDPGIALKHHHQIIQTGPYNILRHPLHLGTILQIAGLASLTPIWLGLPAAITSITLALYLNRSEDLAHAQKFGADYRAYSLHTWDFVDLIFWRKR